MLSHHGQVCSKPSCRASACKARCTAGATARPEGAARAFVSKPSSAGRPVCVRARAAVAAPAPRLLRRRNDVHAGVKALGSFCTKSHKAKTYCDCGANGCGGGLCDNTRKARSYCPCGAKECGSALCVVTETMHTYCKCGAATCGGGLCPNLRSAEAGSARRRAINAPAALAAAQSAARRGARARIESVSTAAAAPPSVPGTSAPSLEKSAAGASCDAKAAGAKWRQSPSCKSGR
jgi:hypothetical protein